MSSPRVIELPVHLRTLATLAALLERLETSREPLPADQYRAVVAKLKTELLAVPQDEAFDQLLSLFPATAELYENERYAHAGLVRTPLERSLDTEAAMREALRRIARG